MKKIAFLIIFAVSVLMITHSVQAETANPDKIIKVAVKNFDVESDKDMNYLEEALPRLVESRLYKKGVVEIIHYSEDLPLKDKVYVVKGSLIKKIQSLELKIALISSEKTLNFNEISNLPESDGEIIVLVDGICGQIKTKIFGQTEKTAPKKEKYSELHDSHMHPDQMIKSLNMKQE